MVFRGLVTACRRATTPTSRSPVLENATTDGVVRKPSALAITLGSPPSMTATHELVVPRSMPMTLPIHAPAFVNERAATPGPGSRPDVAPESWVPALLAGLNLDFAQPGLVGLGHANFEHAVAIGRLDGVTANRGPEREAALEDSAAALDAQLGARLLGLLLLALAADRQRVARQAHLDVLERHP